MEEKQKVLEVLTSEVVGYLRKLSYSESRISQYRSAWLRVAAFMEENDLTHYSAIVGEAFIYHLIGDRKYDNLDRWEKAIIQCANTLTEFLETGAVKFRRCKKFRDLQGTVGQTMRDYITYKKSYGISDITVDGYKLCFQHFLSYLEDNDIHDVCSINLNCTRFKRHSELR
ncbi:hypothetical protein CEB3_c00170 [Peptococcaceae bacterium CEB3]|nr:hypothetical protein CEB3_c00170 [Peptococcaceae bacterium CEB3]